MFKQLQKSGLLSTAASGADSVQRLTPIYTYAARACEVSVTIAIHC
jgi:hypothetical protein